MDCDQHKLFVGGIARGTSEEALRQHFSKYGNVLGAVVAKEKATGQPRGFGFVSFTNDSDVNNALRGAHFILGRAVDVKRAIPKQELLRYQRSNLQTYSGQNEMSNNGITNNRTKKIFVGGLSSNTTEEEFKSYFEKFGRTTDVVVMHDSVTNRPRGFGFVTFDSEDSVEFVMQSSFHELSDKLVEVKRAIPKVGIQSNNSNHNLATTYNNNFQALAYVPQYPPVFGYHHHHGLQGFHYPYGYTLTTAHGLNVPWNNQIMPATGYYTPCHLPYMNGYDPSGMNMAMYNATPWPVAGGDTAGAIISQFENLNLESRHCRMV